MNTCSTYQELPEENGTLTKWLIQSLHGFKYLISTVNYILKEIHIQIVHLTILKLNPDAGAFTQSVREPIAVVFIVSFIYSFIILTLN